MGIFLAARGIHEWYYYTGSTSTVPYDSTQVQQYSVLLLRTGTGRTASTRRNFLFIVPTTILSYMPHAYADSTEIHAGCTDRSFGIYYCVECSSAAWDVRQRGRVKRTRDHVTLGQLRRLLAPTHCHCRDPQGQIAKGRLNMN